TRQAAQRNATHQAEPEVQADRQSAQRDCGRSATHSGRGVSITRRPPYPFGPCRAVPLCARMDSRLRSRPFGGSIMAVEKVVGTVPPASSTRSKNPQKVIAVTTPANYWRTPITHSEIRCSAHVRLKVLYPNSKFSA